MSPDSALYRYAIKRLQLLERDSSQSGGRQPRHKPSSAWRGRRRDGVASIRSFHARVRTRFPGLERTVAP